LFEKAQRKAQESRFFLRRLRTTQELHETEFYFNALLNSGRNVLYAIRARLLASERTRSPATTAPRKAERVYNVHYKAWKRTVPPSHATLFDVLQALRDIDTHTTHSGHLHRARTEERRMLRSIPSDPAYVAVFASYMAMGVLSAEVTVPTTSYDLQVDVATPSRSRVQALLKQFARGKPKPSVEVAAIYADLLDSVVVYFGSHYVEPETSVAAT
jgi:hypothetical protein